MMCGFKRYHGLLHEQSTIMLQEVQTYITLRCITPRSITLHYITYRHTYRIPG